MYINTYLFKCHTHIISEFLTHALYEKYIHGHLGGEGNGTPLQYSCLENPMDGGAW